MNKKTWGILVHLGRNMWGDLRKTNVVEWQDETWEEVFKKCVECKLNTIVIDVAEGVQWKSHPELAIEGSWSYEKVQNEVKRLRSLGIDVIPKLNFSSVHDVWLGDYARMISTDIYYKVCKDLIFETYDMFLQPEYIHIGMDEENWKHVTDKGYEIVTIRRDDLLVKDINYLADCVKETGAKCHMWHDPFKDLEEEYSKDIYDDILPYVWMYYSYLKENWNLIAEQEDEVRIWYETQFVKRYGYTIDYVEESPSVLMAIELLEEFIKKGKKFLMTTSNLYIKNCEKDALEFIRRNDPEFKCFEGMITAPWGRVVADRKDFLCEAIELVGKAKETYEELVK